VHQTLENAVHEAGVAKVLQPSTLQVHAEEFKTFNQKPCLLA
jgi:hypothetical protein